jgi:hypothetical protein
MRNAFSISFLSRTAAAGAVLAGALALGGCSGGSGDDASSVQIKCLGGQSFCLISCDLGCSQTGCALTEIAENQRLKFVFSDRVDPDSVDGASLSIRTGTGVAPDGDYLVSNNEVTFVPKVRTVNGVSTFGFLRNETYIVSLAGGSSASQGIRSIAGDTLGQELTCTVRATRGIQDEDQQPPTVTLVSPTNLIGIPLDPTIVLRFSELIDTAPLQSPLSASSPILVLLRPTLPTGECNRDAEAIVLEGLPQLSTEVVNGRDVTVVTFRPSVTLPGDSCVIVGVTADLRDLSGRAAIPAQFEMITVTGVSVPLQVTETFATPAGQEELVSGGVWNNGARPGLIGGDGRHGSFALTLGGTPPVGGVYTWDLAQAGGIVIPATNTPSGQSFNVTDGRFFFTDFVLPENTTLRFVGPTPPQIFVRGRCEIRGTIDVSAPDMPGTPITTGPLAGNLLTNFNARGALVTPNPLINGQPGGAGGCGGGRGGNGGNECNGLGPTFVGGVNVNNGQPGDTVKVAANHAYAGNAGGTGGAGSPLHNSAGTTASVGLPIIQGSIQFRDEFSVGGGGGGFLQAGGVPITPTIPQPPAITQPNNSPMPAPAAAFALFPLPANPPAGYQSLDHFLVGGSGGGGGGSHAFSTAVPLSDVFMAGHGGSGGGGAVAVRAGGDLTMFATGRILMRGGRNVIINGDNPVTPTADVDFGVSSPGGGGSGGSALLQSGRTLTVSGLIDASGGAGSRVTGVASSLAPGPVFALNVTAQAGAGSPGFYRLEGATTVVFNGAAATVPAFNAATNVGPLTDRDATSGDLAKWRGFNQVFPPTWLRYELEVDTDGNGTTDITYTDTGEPGTQKANDPLGPVVILFQGATLNQAGNAPEPGTIKPWREGIGTGAGPGIQQDAVTGFRFSLSYNRTAFPNQVVKALRVFART